MAGKFVKAKSEQAFLKLGLYGKAGSGKTLTSLLFAEGLAAHSGGRVAFVDTERGSEFYALDIAERRVHPGAFDFDRLITRSMMETLEAVEAIDPREHSVVVIDSITHLWEAARDAYTGKRMSNGGIPVQAWQAIKRPYKRLMALLLDGDYHAIICGREGVVMENNEEGEAEVVGTRMKAEGETPHEPHLLARMAPERDEQGGYIIRVFIEKDRSGILTGRTIHWPTYDTIAPLVAHLSGSGQGKLGTPEENADRDAEAQARAAEEAEADRARLFAAIRDAINSAHAIESLRVAWDLTRGKKGKLGDENWEKLLTLKDARKSEILKAVA